MFVCVCVCMCDGVPLSVILEWQRWVPICHSILRFDWQGRQTWHSCRRCRACYYAYINILINTRSTIEEIMACHHSTVWNPCVHSMLVCVCLCVCVFVLMSRCVPPYLWSLTPHHAFPSCNELNGSPSLLESTLSAHHGLWFGDVRTALTRIYIVNTFGSLFTWIKRLHTSRTAPGLRQPFRGWFSESKFWRELDCKDVTELLFFRGLICHASRDAPIYLAGMHRFIAIGRRSSGRLDTRLTTFKMPFSKSSFRWLSVLSPSFCNFLRKNLCRERRLW